MKHFQTLAEENEKRPDRLKRLIERRGGIVRGDWREVVLRIAATLLRTAAFGTAPVEPSAVLPHVVEFNERFCDPPLSPETCRHLAEKAAGWRKSISSRKIAERLDIKPEEAAVVGWPAAPRFPKDATPRTAKLKERRAMIRRINRLRKQVLPPAQMKWELRGRGIKAELPTIQKDYDDLGIERPRARSRATSNPVDTEIDWG